MEVLDVLAAVLMSGKMVDVWRDAVVVPVL